MLLGNKSASASTATKPASKAEWLAQVAWAKAQPYETYVKVLNEAVKAGALTTKEASELQKQHPNFPKASSGSTTATSVDARVAAALATNNPATIRALAKELEKTHPQVAADLRKAADELDAKLAASQAAAKVPPPVAPKPAPTPAPTPAKTKPPKVVEPAPVMPPAPKIVEPPTAGVEIEPPAVHRERGLILAKHLTGKKKGQEDKSLVEQYQRSYNRQVAGRGEGTGLNPDGKYGYATARSLGELDLVPPKPLYWGAGGSYAALQQEQKDWKAWCNANAAKDAARKPEWLAAAKI